MTGESRIQEKFRNLFDSIAKKNTKKSEIYHEILKEEVDRGQQAFDMMKEELWIAQNRNTYKKRNNVFKKTDINGNVVAAKREISAHSPGISESDSRSRDTKFKEKYCGRQYQVWEKMQAADNNTLANICLKFFSFEKESDEGAAEAHRRTNTSVMYGKLDEVTLDLIQCKIRYRNVKQEITGEAVYYLADGFEKDSAFKCFLIPSLVPKQRIILGGIVKNIWNQTIDPSAKLGSISSLDINFYKN